MKKKMKLDQQALKYAILGGCILGGGGGGDMQRGLSIGGVSIDYADLWLWDLEETDNTEMLVCASAVGAPKAPDQYYTPWHAVEAMKLFMKNNDTPVAGIISNENGGIATVNGWIQAAVLGIPLIDAPCNGRAHPTGVMGSLSLHKNPDYMTVQAAVGGNPQTGHYVECVTKGTVARTSSLVRTASVEAGGMVYVVRNPVSAAYVKEHAAIGGISHAIEVGRVFYEALETSPEQAVKAVAELLGGTLHPKERVEEFSIETQGGFDVGYATIGAFHLTFWNEYMTLDSAEKRLATFPELIMTFDAVSGMPITTAQMEQGQEIYILTAPMEAMKLSSTMYETQLMEQVESVVQKEMVKYLPADKMR